MYGIGYNMKGSLGIGNNIDQSTLKVVKRFPNIKNIYSGCFHLIIMLDNGDIYGCGDNKEGFFN